MRLNKFIATATGMSRRTADRVVENGGVTINGVDAMVGQTVNEGDVVVMNGRTITVPAQHTTVLLNKPVGYIVSRDGQGGRTIYDLLPKSLHTLKPVGRLDKDSSGLLILTDDGDLAQQLTHPSYQKTKVYEVRLTKALQPLHQQMIGDFGVDLPDGKSQLGLERIKEGDNTNWRVTMHEGRNRQIRRTFEALGYKVGRLHRTQFGAYNLQGVAVGSFRAI